MKNKLFYKEVEEMAADLSGEYWSTFIDIQKYIIETNIPYKDQNKIMQDNILILRGAMEKGHSVKSIIGESTAEYCKNIVNEIYPFLSLKDKVLMFLERLFFGVSVTFSFFSILLIIDFIFNRNILLQSNGNVKIELVQILSLIMLVIWFPLINKTNKNLKNPSFIKKVIIFILYTIALFIFSLIVFSIVDAIAPRNLYLNAYLLLGLTVAIIIMTYFFSKFINK